MKLPIPIGIMAGCLLFAGIIYIQIGVWNECRQEHSFFYCLNLVGNR